MRHESHLWVVRLLRAKNIHHGRTENLEDTQPIKAMKKYFLPLLIIIGSWSGIAPTFGASSGTVVAWGGITTVPTNAQSGVTDVAAGLGHIVALKTNGTVVAWGDN